MFFFCINVPRERNPQKRKKHCWELSFEALAAKVAAAAATEIRYRDSEIYACVFDIELIFWGARDGVNARDIEKRKNLRPTINIIGV